MPSAQFRPIRRKLIWIVLATTFMALLCAGVALLIFDLQSSRKSWENDLRTQADILGQASATALAFDDPKVASENLALLKARPDIVAAAIYNARGALFARYATARFGDFPAQPRADATDVDSQYVVVFKRVESGGELLGTIYLQARHGLVQRVQHYLGVLALIMAASLLVALALSNRMQVAITRPILAISDVAHKIVEGRDFSLRATRTTNDEIGYVVDAFNNMLDELARRAEVLEESNRALRASEERYQLAVSGSGVGLWDWDIATGDTFYAPRFRELLGYGESGLGQSGFGNTFAVFTDALHPQDRAVFQQSLDGHFSSQATPHEVECRLRTHLGTHRWFYARGEALRDAQGKPYRMAGSIIDITERKLAQQETLRLNAELEDRVKRRTAQLEVANKELEAFSYSASHDLRSPLNAIDGFSSLLEKQIAGDGNERSKHFVNRIRTNVKHMGQLIDALLALAHVSRASVKRQPVDLSALAERAVEDCREREPQRSARVRVDAGMSVQGDPVLLKQVIENLVGNAWKFTGKQDTTRIAVGSEYSTADGELRYFVRDNGAGFDMAYAEKLFGTFQRLHSDTEFAGTGIGLATVHRIISRHNGHVWAESAPGQGATFFFTLGLAGPSGFQ